MRPECRGNATLASMERLFLHVIEPLLRPLTAPSVRCLEVYDGTLVAKLASFCLESRGTLAFAVSAKSHIRTGMDLVEIAAAGRCTIDQMPRGRMHEIDTRCDALIVDVRLFTQEEASAIWRTVLSLCRAGTSGLSIVVVLHDDNAQNERVLLPENPFFQRLSFPGMTDATVFVRTEAIGRLPSLRMKTDQLHAGDAYKAYVRTLLAVPIQGNASPATPQLPVSRRALAEKERALQQQQRIAQELRMLIDRMEQTKSWRWTHVLRSAPALLHRWPATLRQWWESRGMGVCIWSDGSGNLERCVLSMLPWIEPSDMLILDAAGHGETARTAHAFDPPLVFRHGDWSGPLHAFRAVAPSMRAKWLLCIVKPQEVDEETVRRCRDRLRHGSFRRYGLIGASSAGNAPIPSWSSTHWPLAILRRDDLAALPPPAPFAVCWNDLFGNLHEPFLLESGQAAANTAETYCPGPDAEQAPSAYPVAP